MSLSKLHGLKPLTPEYRKEDGCWGFWFSSSIPYNIRRIQKYPNVSHWWVWFKTKKECVHALKEIRQGSKRKKNDLTLTMLIQEGVAYPIMTKEFLVDAAPIRRKVRYKHGKLDQLWNFEA